MTFTFILAIEFTKAVIIGFKTGRDTNEGRRDKISVDKHYKDPETNDALTSRRIQTWRKEREGEE